MHRLSIVIITLFITMNIFPQNRSTDRQPVAAGSFYPGNKDELEKELAQLFKSCHKTSETWKVRAIISPHAGYVFSGETAASAYSSIPVKSKYKNIFLIGSSHVMAFDGASIYNTGDYITPLGKVKVNLEIANKLKNSSDVFKFPVTAHIQEHSLEVQMPFIQYHFPDPPPVIPIIIGTNNINRIQEIARALKPWFNEDNLFIISSDFSHYPPYNDARVTDKLTADAIISGDPDNFMNTLRKNESKSIPGLATSMCGWTSGLTLMYLAENNPDLRYIKIDYSNSGDSPYGNKSEVVGYNAIVLIEKKNGGAQDRTSEDQVAFTNDEADKLFSIARSSIREKLYENKVLRVNEKDLPPKLKEKMGAFVTLKINSNLRGCIGRFTSDEPLYEVVNEMALASAFSDTRFYPLTKEEFDKTDIEISVLGPLRKINDTSEIILGKHGIYIKKDFRSGTMLPQVAIENNWTLDEFLGYTSRDKAGLGWLGWKNADIYVYEAVVLEERKK